MSENEVHIEKPAELVSIVLEAKLPRISDLETIKETVEEPIKENPADTLFKKVAESVKQRLGDIQPDFPLLIKIAMEEVEKTDVKGVSQKDLAIGAIRLVAQSIPLHISVLALIDTDVIGDAIELVVSATKGEINVNKIVATGVKACLLGCFGKKK